MAKKKVEEEISLIEEIAAEIKKDLKAEFIARKLKVINTITDEDKARKMANRILYHK